MKKIFFLLITLFFVLLQSCAATPPLISHDCEFSIKKTNLGVQVEKDLDCQVRVIRVLKGSPGEKAGIREGDIIKSIDGYSIKKGVDLTNTIKKKEPGDVVLVTVERNHTKLDFNVTLNSALLCPVSVAITRMLIDEEKKVNLAVIMGEINNVTIRNQHSLKQWKKVVKADQMGTMENVLLVTFGLYRNFMLVDRQKVDEILKEQVLGQTGAISEDTRNKLGQLFGATHLLITSFSRSPRRIGREDILKNRLIEIETGEVLASEIHRYKYRY